MPEKPVAVKRLSLEDPPEGLEPPKDCRWSFWADAERFGFSRPGEFSLINAFLTLVVALVVNGALIAILLAQFGLLPNAKPAQDVPWWGVPLFLVPFFAFGLLLLTAFFLTVTEPFRRRTWMISPQGLEYRDSRFRWSEYRKQPLHGLAGLRLRRGRIPRRGRKPDSDQDGTDWRLVFSDEKEADLAAIDELTEGEALWMADVVLRERGRIERFDLSESPANLEKSRPVFHVETDGSTWTARWKSSRDGSGCFLSLFLVAWLAGGVTLGYQMLDDADMLDFLKVVVACVYAVSVVAIVVWASYAVFGRKTLRLDGDGFFLESRTPFGERSRRIPLSELRYFEAVFPAAESEDEESGKDAAGIRLVSLGPEWLVMDGPRDEILALLPKMNAALADLKRRAGLAAETPPETDFETESETPPPEPETILLDEPASDLSPPSDCRWTAETTFDRLRFQNRGVFQAGHALTILGATVFWNGILAVFLANLWGFEGEPPQGVGWWGLFVFLIPFQIVGLGLAGVLLLALLEPFRMTTLDFSYGAFSRRTTWFGLGFTRRRSLSGLHRMELRSLASKKQQLEQSRTNSLPFDRVADWRIAFLDENGAGQAEIAELTEGEARWMADVILHEKKLIV